MTITSAENTQHVTYADYPAYFKQNMALPMIVFIGEMASLLAKGGDISSQLPVAAAKLEQDAREQFSVYLRENIQSPNDIFIQKIKLDRTKDEIAEFWQEGVQEILDIKNYPGKAERVMLGYHAVLSENQGQNADRSLTAFFSETCGNHVSTCISQLAARGEKPYSW